MELLLKFYETNSAHHRETYGGCKPDPLTFALEFLLSLTVEMLFSSWAQRNPSSHLISTHFPKSCPHTGLIYPRASFYFKLPIPLSLRTLFSLNYHKLVIKCFSRQGWWTIEEIVIFHPQHLCNMPWWLYWDSRRQSSPECPPQQQRRMMPAAIFCGRLPFYPQCQKCWFTEEKSLVKSVGMDCIYPRWGNSTIFLQI
jgi:hypothetical protein